MTDRLLEQLAGAEARYLGMEASLSDPAVIADPAKYADVMKEYRRLSPIIDVLRAYRRAEADAEEAQRLLDDAQDAELRELAADELKTARAESERLSRELTVLLLPRDPNDEKNVLMEIRAGAGGEEAALFAADLYRMYCMYADANGFRTSLMSQTPTELGGFRAIVFRVEGDGAYSRLRYESGVHRVQRVPTTESQGRIQTSTATVAVLPEADEVEVEINPADLVFESCKSSGAGGQHINKTESAVRLTHKPTGIVVECQEERSQFKNKDKALRMLRTILYDRARREQNEQVAADRRGQVGTGDRSEKIRTYNFPQNRVTDHRIGLSLHSLDSFLNGRIEVMLEALATADTAKKMAHDAE